MFPPLDEVLMRAGWKSLEEAGKETGLPSGTLYATNANLLRGGGYRTLEITLRLCDAAGVSVEEYMRRVVSYQEEHSVS